RFDWNKLAASAQLMLSDIDLVLCEAEVPSLPFGEGGQTIFCRSQLQDRGGEAAVTPDVCDNSHSRCPIACWPRANAPQRGTGNPVRATRGLSPGEQTCSRRADGPGVNGGPPRASASREERLPTVRPASNDPDSTGRRRAFNSVP